MSKLWIGCVIFAYSQSVILHDEVEMGIILCNLNPNISAFIAVIKAMQDGIFNQRLQHDF